MAGIHSARIGANTQEFNGDLTASTLSLTDREPVLVLAFVGWVVANAGDLAVNRFHWLTEGDWSSISHYAVPLGVTVVTAGAGWLIRRMVTPVKKVEAILNGQLERSGLLTDADHAMLLSAIGQHLPELIERSIDRVVTVTRMPSVAPTTALATGPVPADGALAIAK